MNWQDILLIVIPLGGFMAWIYSRIDKRFDGVNAELKETNSKLNDIDKRLYAVETVLHMKDCCVLKQDQNLRKVDG